MASVLQVEEIRGPTSGDNANKIIIPSGQTLDIGAWAPPAGTVIQVTNHKTTTQLSSSGVGGLSSSSTISATDGVTYTTFDFTPQSGTSKLLLLSTVFIINERINASDVIFAAASYGNTTMIGTVMNYNGYSNWSGNLDSAFVSFNHLFDSWGTDAKTIRIAVGGNNSTSNFAVNYPNQSDSSYAGQYPNQHDVTFTVMEIAQ